MTCLKEFADEECCEGKNGNKCALVEYVKAHTACENAFLAVTGFTLHKISFGFFKAECKSRNTVCYKVDEKKMNGLKNCEAEDCCCED